MSIQKITVSFFLLCLIFIISNKLNAVKAYPFPVEIVQPDGSKLTVQLKGDEFHHYHTTEDGYLIAKNNKGFFTYATMDKKGKTIPSNYIARNISSRKTSERNFLKTIAKSVPQQLSQSTTSASSRVKQIATTTQANNVTPFIGTQKALVIMVNFTDKAFVVPTPQTAFSNLLNQKNYSENGGTGSARDYFIASSYGKFTPDFDIVGPYTLSQNMAYYGTNDIYGYDSLPQNMVVEACQLADQAGLDFTKYDVNSDGKIDNVFIYYAGYNEAEGAADNTIWPHRWNIYPKSLYPNDYNFNDKDISVYFDGKRLFDYACTSELKGNSGTNMCGIGTFAHEFGHVLGLPDYYDTSGLQTNTLNWWSIMDYGAYANAGRTPPTYSVYDRFFLGYFTPQQMSSPSSLTLRPISQADTIPASTNQQAYLFSSSTHNLNGSSPSPNEFFMVEYRKKIGWDSYLPTEGMLIWHIDYNQTAWTNNTPNNYTGTTQTYSSHMRVYLQPLSGSTTTPGTAFTSGTFTPTTWAGVDINRGIYDITKTADSISFKIMQAKLYNITEPAAFTTLVGTPSDLQNIVVTAINLTDNLNLAFDAGVNFEIKLPTQSTWEKSLSLTPVSGSVNQIVNIRYNPLTAGEQTDSLTLSSNGNGLTNYVVSLSGTSTNPVPPLIKAGVIENSLTFGPTKVNSIRTKILNIKTTDLTSDLTVTLTGADASNFSVSTSAISMTSANGVSGYNININYSPNSTATHNATLTISGGGLNPEKVINLVGTGY